MSRSVRVGPACLGVMALQTSQLSGAVVTEANHLKLASGAVVPCICQNVFKVIINCPKKLVCHEDSYDDGQNGSFS